MNSGSGYLEITEMGQLLQVRRNNEVCFCSPGKLSSLSSQEYNLKEYQVRLNIKTVEEKLRMVMEKWDHDENGALDVKLPRIIKDSFDNLLTWLVFVQWAEFATMITSSLDDFNVIPSRTARCDTSLVFTCIYSSSDTRFGGVQS